MPIDDRREVNAAYQRLYNGIQDLGAKLIEGDRRDISVEERERKLNNALSALTSLYEAFPLPYEDQFRNLMVERFREAQLKPDFKENEVAWFTVMEKLGIPLG